MLLSPSIPSIPFAKVLSSYPPRIVAHGRWSLGTNFVEGTNNKIKVTERMAYALRDDVYFVLKIRATFLRNEG